ncbi:hypothetical protein ACOSQ3_001760 [Xanthoceras sorbifolium]
MNCMLWIFYGLPFVTPDSVLVVTINSVGLLLEIVYITIFFIYVQRKGQTKVIKTRSVKYMPFYLSLTNFLNGLVWVTYALIRFDLYVLTGNGLGALSGAVQLILYACYFKSTPKDDEEKPNHEVQLPGYNAPAPPPSS